MSLFVTRLGSEHQRERFASGDEDLDQWFRRYARQDDRRYGTAAVWVLCDDQIEGGNVPVGYYTLSTHAVVHAEISAAGLPQARQWSDPVPAVLLGRLAIAQYRQGEGLGTRLLRDAVDKVLEMRRFVAVVLLLVDATDEHAARFYLDRGFVRLNDRRLAARVKDLEASL